MPQVPILSSVVDKIRWAARLKPRRGGAVERQSVSHDSRSGENCEKVGAAPHAGGKFCLSKAVLRACNDVHSLALFARKCYIIIK